MFKKVKRYLKDPYFALGCDMIQKCPDRMSDSFFLKTRWQLAMGYKLDMKNPQTFNEKLQWLKLYDHNPVYVKLVDKIAVKEWVSEKIGTQYVIPTIAVYNNADEIDLDKLPNQFVLKCNHDSGSVVLCKDRENFNFEEAKTKLSAALNVNYYRSEREWAYKYIEPKIIAEKYMEDENSSDLPDYKYFCFNGKVEALFIATERQNLSTETRFDFFDTNFNHIEVTNYHPNADVLPSKPKNFEKMIKLAEVLSEGFPEVRVDFYEVNGKVYFGEMTFYHFAGIYPFNPISFDRYLGNQIILPKKITYSPI